MGKNKSKSNKNKGPQRRVDAKAVQGRALLGPLTVPNGAGTLVVDKFRLSTDLTSSTINLAKVFNKWRPKKFKFSLHTSSPATTKVAINMCVVEDPQSAGPSTISDFIENKFSSGIDMTRKLPPLKYIPDHKVNGGWFFTDLNATGDDRLEYPGDLFVGTWGWLTGDSPTPGIMYILVEFEMEFIDFQNETVSPAKPVKPLTPYLELNSVTSDEEQKFKKWLSDKVSQL